MPHELSLEASPVRGLSKVPTLGESSTASLPWMKNPLKVVLLAAESVTVSQHKRMQSELKMFISSCTMYNHFYTHISVALNIRCISFIIYS